MAATRKTKPTEQAPDESDGVTLDQALEEEGEGRTPESLSQRPTKSDGPSKMDRAIKIMEEMWADLQAGKVKRKDVIERFMDEADLTKAGSSTYYGNIKRKLTKTA